MKIVFVCTGNTCRSPMAKEILRARLKELGITTVKVSSAGINAQFGAYTEAKAITALKNLGINARRAKSRQAMPEEMKRADYVITMTAQQKYVLNMRGFNNVTSIGDMTGYGDVSDPYMMGQAEYNSCALVLKMSIEALLPKLLK